MRILTFKSRRYICKFSCAKAEAIFRYAGDIGERDGGSRETESGTNSLLPFSSHRWFGSLLSQDSGTNRAMIGRKGGRKWSQLRGTGWSLLDIPTW